MQQPPNPYGQPNPYAQPTPGQPQQGGYPQQQGGYPPQQPGYPQQGGYPQGQGGYEFTSTEEGLITTLAGSMKFVSIALIVLGALSALGGLAALARVPAEGLKGLITGAFYVVIGIWTLRAAASFKLVVTTQGNDVPNMMNALVELNRVFTLQKIMFIILIVIVVLAFVFGIIAAVAVGAGAH